MLLVLIASLSFGGVVLVSISDSQQSSDDTSAFDQPHSSFGPAPIVGDALALFSALFYALYVTLLKVRIRVESRIDMQLFFGFVGLFNILFCWPIGVALHLARVERFELPTSSRVIVGMLINVSRSVGYPVAIINHIPCDRWL